jgi:ABC-type transporter Mla subunit MlaD
MQLVVDSVGRDMRITLASVQKLVTAFDATVQSASATLRSANSVLLAMNSEIPGILKNLNTTLVSADSAIRGIHDMTPATVATLDSMRALLGDSRVALARATQFIDVNEPQLTSTLANLDQASAVLNNLLREVSRRPLKAITGVKPPAVVTPPVRQAGTTSATKAGERPQ